MEERPLIDPSNPSLGRMHKSSSWAGTVTDYHDGPYCFACGQCGTCYYAASSLWRDPCPDPDPAKANPYTGYGPHEWNKGGTTWRG